MVDIYINNIKLDPPKEGFNQFAATYSLSDIESITDRKGDSTKTITCPLTKINRAALGFPEEINSEVQNIDLIARAEEDNMPIFNGFAYLDGTVTSFITAGEISFIILGSNADWMNKIVKKNINELNLSDYNHTFNQTNVDASETAGLPYVYDIADRGMSYFSAYANQLSIYDRFPALNIAYLFNRIINETGYTINSAFLLTDEFIKKYISFSNNQLSNSNQFRVFKRAKGRRASSDQTLTGLDFVAGRLMFNDAHTYGSGVEPIWGYPFSVTYWNETEGWYEVPYDMITKFKVYLKLQWVYAPTTDSNFFIYIINRKASGVDGTIFDGVPITINGEDFKEFQISSDGIYEYSFETDWVHLGAGSKVYVKINQSVAMRTLGLSELKIGSFIQNEIDPQLCDGQPMEWADNLPNINQLDFISAIKHLFNLYFETDTINRVVRIEPRDQIYSTDSDDWTDLLDISKNMEISEIGKDYAKKIRFGYKEDGSDGYMERVNKGLSTPYQSYDYETGRIMAEDGVDEMMNNLFAATFMANCPRYDLFTTKIPRLWKEYKPGEIPERQISFLPRIWHYNGVQTLPLGDVVRLTTYNAAEYTYTNSARTTWPQFYSFNIAAVNGDSLSFANQLNCIGLFEKYYRNIMSVISRGKRFVGYFYLTGVQINKLSLTKLILLYINDEPTLFYIDKISEYKGKEQVTKVELITYIGNKPAQNTVITSELTEDLITYGERSTPGSYSITVIDGVLCFRIASPSGMTTVMRAERGNIDSGVMDAVTEISGVITQAYTEIDGKYYKATT